MLITLAALGIGVAVAAAAWLALSRGIRAWHHYHAQLSEDAQRTLMASFLFLDMHQLWAGAVALSVLLLLLAWWLGGQWWALLPASALILWAPGLLLRRWRKRRLAQFDRQLPDLLQALAGALRAGSGVQPALQHIVSQSMPPLSQEFTLLLREQRMGLSFQQALAQLQARMPTEACQLVVAALSIAAQTGGNLSDTLEAIAETLRARQHWMGRVHALTAQGRMQSHLMAALPILLMVVLSRLEPEAMGLLWQTPVGWVVLCVILTLEIMGLIWIRRVVLIDI